MLNRKQTLPVLLCSALMMFGLSTQAGAAIVQFNLTPFTGDPTEATITVDDMINAGFFTVTVKVDDTNTGNLGDITGVFFDAGGAAKGQLLTTADITGITDTHIGFGTNTSNLGGGVNLTGGGPNNPGTFDVGVRFDGNNAGFFSTIEFRIADPAANVDLDLSDFSRFALRLQTVGPAPNGGGGSSKLVSGGPTPVPVPSAALLFGTGLLGLIGIARRKKSNQHK